MNQLGQLAYSIWDTEFGDHSTALERQQKALLVSGYLEANLGQLNVFLNTDFELTAKDKVSPELKYEEKAIFAQIYLKDYYQKQARNILRNITQSDTTSSSVTTGVTDWTSIQEGDTVIRRSVASATTKNESARALQNASKEANEMLKKMIHAYNMYGALPLQVAGKDAVRATGSA